MIVGSLYADYVGTQNCLAACHEHDQLRLYFDTSTMGAQLKKESGMPLVDCESCHGPGSLAIKDLTPELGAVKGFYLTRASDPDTRSIAQHGGTDTTLMSLALSEGIIDTALLAEGGGSDLPSGVAVSQASEVSKLAKSKFIAAPMVEAFNMAAQSDAQRLQEQAQ